MADGDARLLGGAVGGLGHEFIPLGFHEGEDLGEFFLLFGGEALEGLGGLGGEGVPLGFEGGGFFAGEAVAGGGFGFGEEGFEAVEEAIGLRDAEFFGGPVEGGSGEFFGFVEGFGGGGGGGFGGFDGGGFGIGGEVSGGGFGFGGEVSGGGFGTFGGGGGGGLGLGGGVFGLVAGGEAEEGGGGEEEGSGFHGVGARRLGCVERWTGPGFRRGAEEPEVLPRR